MAGCPGLNTERLNRPSVGVRGFTLQHRGVRIQWLFRLLMSILCSSREGIELLELPQVSSAFRLLNTILSSSLKTPYLLLLGNLRAATSPKISAGARALVLTFQLSNAGQLPDVMLTLTLTLRISSSHSRATTP